MDPILVNTAIVPARDVDGKETRVAVLFYSDGSVKWEPAK